jgi:tetratricopeptide (TPR) repeat protein
MNDPAQAAMLALEALQRSALPEAERLSHAAYRAAPKDPSVLLAYGAVLDARGSFHEAARIFRRLTELQPQVASHWMNLGTALRSSGDAAAALDAYVHAESLGLDTPDFFYSAGLLLADRGELAKARDFLSRAAMQAPLDAEIRFHHARLCFALVDTDATIAALRDWPQWQGMTVEMLAAVGALQLQLGEQRDAERILDLLKAQATPTPEIEVQIAGMLERTNRVAEAQQQFARVAQPDASDPLYRRWAAVRAQLATRAGDLAQAEALHRDILARTTDPHETQNPLFALAKVLDARGDYAAALEAITAAHAAQVAALDRTGNAVDEEREIMGITRWGCDADDARRWTEAASPSVEDSPVFIVAFPRSGTTLLEHMLDAHPALQTMDEQPFLQKAVLRFSKHALQYPDHLKDMTDAQLADIRRYYWDLVANRVRIEPGQRLLDKNPLNMLRLPAIKRLFPNAPILLAIRHPCDVVISNFFQHYRAPEFVRLCRDLPTLALAWRKAFDFWYEQAALLQPRALEVRYESFVADFENASRRIAEFVQLPWHDDMLKPGAHALAKGYISTPSYSQVVQPVNSKAVGRWRRYESAMAPVVDEVRPYLERWGY